MKRVWIWVAMVLCVIPILTACEKIGKGGAKGKELVRINDVSISLEDFRQISEGQSLEGKMRLLNEKGLRDFLDNYVITREVLYQEAVKKGFDSNKEIIAKVEDFKRAMLIDALLEEALRGKGEVSDQEVEQYYKENEALFTEPREIKISHIVVASEASLREVLLKLSKGERFENLASAYNIDKSKEDGGSLGFIQRGQLASSFSQFEEAAFALQKKGDRSGVVKTPYGFHIIRLDERKGKTVRPLAQVKEKIRAFLQTKKKQDAYLQFVKDAKSRAKIAINESLWAEEEKKEKELQSKEEQKEVKPEEKK